MTLSQDQKSMMEAHFRESSISKCPMCGHNNWALQDTIKYLGVYDAEYQQPVEGKFFPTIAAICEKCFYTALFSATRLGIVN